MNITLYNRYQIARHLSMLDNLQNRNIIDRHLTKIRFQDQTEPFIEDLMLDKICEIFKIERSDLQKGGRGNRICSDAKKILSHCFSYHCEFTDDYIGFLFKNSRVAMYHARMDLRGILKFDKDLREKFEQFNQYLNEIK